MTKQMRMFAFGLACFVFGVVVQTGLAQKKGRTAFNAEVYQGKEPKAAATALLDQAHRNRPKAEELFTKALTKNQGDFWHWVGVGGSYLGVAPQ